jgi:hypothetical protein
MRDRVHPILPFPFMVCFAAAGCDSDTVSPAEETGVDATIVDTRTEESAVDTRPAATDVGDAADTADAEHPVEAGDAFDTSESGDVGVGIDSGTDVSVADTYEVGGDTTLAEVGHCHFTGMDGGIECEAGSFCYAAGETFSGPEPECRPAPGAPLNCGAIGCAWDCRCESVPLAECACAYLTSTLRAKRDIEYVDQSAEARLHDELMAVRLATYRYRPGVTGEENVHLGFIIEDMPEDSPAVLPSRERVDVYGYLSMAVAALKVQERELADLRARVARLEGERTPGGAS